MLSSIVSPLDGFRSPFGAQRGFNPARLFGLSDTGWFYDQNDLTTMFQESAGTTPAAIGSPVGLMLDKSKGLVLGPELVTNGDNEASLFSTAGGPSATRGTLVRSTDLGGASAKFTGTASGTVYINPFGGALFSGSKSVRISFRVYIPSAWVGSGIRVVDTSDGSYLSAFTNTRDQWVSVSVFRPAKGSAWPIGIGDNFVNNQTGLSFYIDDLSIRELLGNHSSQSTPSFRGVLQGSPSRLVLDGSDDRYVTTLNPTASGTIAARIRGATASRVVAGSQGATDGRALLALAADGSIAAGIGAQSTAVIKGTVDKRNVWVTACVTWNGTTVRLYEDGVEVYSGAQSGAVNTTVPFIYGALNANGTASAFWDDDIGASLVISRAITATEAVQLHNAWRNIA